MPGGDVPFLLQLGCGKADPGLSRPVQNQNSSVRFRVCGGSGRTSLPSEISGHVFAYSVPLGEVTSTIRR